jgi:23S rRNA (uracil1939-C5)-methyltransferase
LLIDAFCGGGLFATHLAPRFAETIGIEENVFAVEQARRDASERVRFIAGNVEEYLGEILSVHDRGRTTVLLDPPKTGLSERVLDLLSGTPVSQLVYVSCNPATLARDLAGLAATYQLISVTPFDMFPQTAEVEVVVFMEPMAHALPRGNRDNSSV